MRRAAFGGLATLLLLAGCNRSAPEQQEEATEVPEELAGPGARPAVPADADDSGATPLQERVATLGLLNKRNNITREVEMRPGEARRFGDVVLRLATCERTAPWEDPPETGAFVQVSIRERTDADSQPQWRRVFSGWLFRNSPGLNVVEHPIYDVWVKDCAMSFPGEEATPAPAASGSASASSAT